MGIDLHAHTTASDGDQAPAQLVALAASCGLSAIGVTDHDTTDGLPEALEAGRALGVQVVPGIELSADFSKGQCHILGYLIRPDDAALVTRLRAVRANRDRRNAQMLDKLRDLGIPVTMQQVQQIAGGDILARPHFARALVQLGVVDTVQEAFDRYLADGAAGHVPKDKISPAEAIALIHGAGGLAILAHPNNLKRDAETTEREITALHDLGLDGIEARYSQHTAGDTARYLELAERLRLVTTGGSDFHGPSVKPHIRLGQVEQGIPAPDELLAALRRRRQC